MKSEKLGNPSRIHRDPFYLKNPSARLRRHWAHPASGVDGRAARAWEIRWGRSFRASPRSDQAETRRLARRSPAAADPARLAAGYAGSIFVVCVGSSSPPPPPLRQSTPPNHGHHHRRPPAAVLGTYIRHGRAPSHGTTHHTAARGRGTARAAGCSARLPGGGPLRPPPAAQRRTTSSACPATRLQRYMNHQLHSLMVQNTKRRWAGGVVVAGAGKAEGRTRPSAAALVIQFSRSGRSHLRRQSLCSTSRTDVCTCGAAGRGQGRRRRRRSAPPPLQEREQRTPPA